jgi:hypothetical protein
VTNVPPNSLVHGLLGVLKVYFQLLTNSQQTSFFAVNNSIYKVGIETKAKEAPSEEDSMSLLLDLSECPFG